MARTDGKFWLTRSVFALAINETAILALNRLPNQENILLPKDHAAGDADCVGLPIRYELFLDSVSLTNKGN